MAILIKSLHNDKCSSCNASGIGSTLWEFSIARSNTIQGSMLYYRLCIDCVGDMKSRLELIEEGVSIEESIKGIQR